MGGNEVPQGGERGVLLTVFPLLLGEKNHGAGCGIGIGMFLDDGFELRDVGGLAEVGPGGLLVAFLDPPVNHERGGSDDQ